MTKQSKRLQERRARQNGGLSRAQIHGYAAQVSVNGSRAGGTLFCPASTAAVLLREYGNIEAADVVATWGDALVCIKDGKMFLAEEADEI